MAPEITLGAFALFPSLLFLPREKYPPRGHAGTAQPSSLCRSLLLCSKGEALSLFLKRCPRSYFAWIDRVYSLGVMPVACLK